MTVPKPIPQRSFAFSFRRREVVLRVDLTGRVAQIFATLSIVAVGCASPPSSRAAEMVITTAIIPPQSKSKIEVKVTAPTPMERSAIAEIKNSDPFANVVNLKLFNDSVDTEVIGEITVTVGGLERIQVAVDPKDGKKFSTKVASRVGWRLGSTKSPQKDNRFLIPFPNGVKVNVCQSFDGPQLTHRATPYAIDFCVAEKTPIVAAKDGVVVDVVDTFTEGGLDPALLDKANRIAILHDDGIRTSYLHIFPKSATVDVGEKVKKGQAIALVGSVGFSGRPHLHFGASYIDSSLNEIEVNPNGTYFSPMTLKSRG